MKLTMLELQPGAEIPPHTHKGPGLRYVVEGAISVAWKDRETQTFKAGSTYFEGARENHPPGQMSAKNAADSVTRVVIANSCPRNKALAFAQQALPQLRHADHRGSGRQRSIGVGHRASSQDNRKKADPSGVTIGVHCDPAPTAFQLLPALNKAP